MARRSRRSEYRGRPYVAGSSFDLELPRDELRLSLDAFEVPAVGVPGWVSLARQARSWRVLEPVSRRSPPRAPAPPWGGGGVPFALVTKFPRQVRYCMQRHSRREVLFARGVAGRRGSAPGPYRRKESSNWRC